MARRTARERSAFPVFEPSARNLGLALARLAGTLLSVASALALGELVDAVATGSPAGGEAACALLAYLAVSLVAALANFCLVGWLPMRLDLRRETRASERAVELVLSMSQRAFARHDAGHYLNLVTMVAGVSGSAYTYLSVSVAVAALQIFSLACAPLADCVDFVGFLVSNLESLRLLRALEREAAEPSGFERLRRAPGDAAARRGTPEFRSDGHGASDGRHS